MWRRICSLSFCQGRGKQHTQPWEIAITITYLFRPWGGALLLHVKRVTPPLPNLSWSRCSFQSLQLPQTPTLLNPPPTTSHCIPSPTQTLYASPISSQYSDPFSPPRLYPHWFPLKPLHPNRSLQAPPPLSTLLTSSTLSIHSTTSTTLSKNPTIMQPCFQTLNCKYVPVGRLLLTAPSM